MIIEEIKYPDKLAPIGGCPAVKIPEPAPKLDISLSLRIGFEEVTLQMTSDLKATDHYDNYQNCERLLQQCLYRLFNKHLT